MKRLCLAAAILVSAGCGADERSSADVEEQLVGYTSPGGYKVEAARCIKEAADAFVCDVRAMWVEDGSESGFRWKVRCDDQDCLPVSGE